MSSNESIQSICQTAAVESLKSAVHSREAARLIALVGERIGGTSKAASKTPPAKATKKRPAASKSNSWCYDLRYKPNRIAPKAKAMKARKQN